MIPRIGEIIEKFKQSGSNPFPPCPKCGGDVTREETEFFHTELCENCFEHAKVVYKEDACCKQPAIQHVKFITVAKTIQVRSQCGRCGKMDGKILGGFTLSQKERMPLADIVKREKRWTYINGAWNLLHNKRDEGRAILFRKERQEWRVNYEAYLQSSLWKRKRQLILKRDSHLCQSCLLNPATEVHHKSYQFVDFTGKEPCYDLFSVCGTCHIMIHDFLNSKNQ